MVTWNVHEQSLEDGIISNRFNQRCFRWKVVVKRCVVQPHLRCDLTCTQSFEAVLSNALICCLNKCLTPLIGVCCWSGGCSGHFRFLLPLPVICFNHLVEE